MVLVNIRIRDPASCNDVWVKSSNYDAWKHAGSSGAKGGIGKGKRGWRLLKAQGSEIQKRALPGKRKEGDRKVMNKIFKRLLSVVLAVVMVIGLVPLSGASTVEAAGTQKIYLDLSRLSNADRSRWTNPGVHAMDKDNQPVNDNMGMTKITNTLYFAEISDQATKVIFNPNNAWNLGQTETVEIAAAGADQNTTFPMYLIIRYQAGSKEGWKGRWSTYSEDDVDTEETFMVNADLWDYFNNHRVGTDGKIYNPDNEGNGTDKDEPVYSAWNYVISGFDGTNLTDDTPTYPLYFGGLGHRTNRKMQEIKNDNWKIHGLPNFSLTANVALEDYGNAAVQGAVDKQLKNGNLADPNTKNELPYFKETPLYNEGKQVTAFYPDLQFPFKKTTSASGQTTYSYDSATDYAVYYNYDTHKLDTSYVYSYNQTLDGNNDNEKGYYPFDNAKGYNPGSGNSYNKTAANNRNMGFGTKFTIPFTLSMDENRQINGQDVVFRFTGDDDVWVFIDNVLVLDMGGAHYRASGQIDFTNQTVTVDQAFSIQEPTGWTNGDFVETPGNPSWDKPTSETAGVTVGGATEHFSKITGVFTGETETKSLSDILEDDTKVHTLTMFYMERGMYDSNMSISFTFNPVPSGLVLSKEVNTANVNSGLAETVKTKDYFDFTIEKAGHNSSDYSAASDIQYTKEYDGAGSESATTTSEGLVENLADNIYAHDFRTTDESGNITRPFALGDKLKITETGVDSSKYSTEWRVWDLRENKLVAEEKDDNSSDDTMAQFTLGTYTEDLYAPGVNYAANFVNTPKVAPVTLTKSWETGSAEEGDKFEFEVLVDLDGDGSDYTYAPYELEYTYVEPQKTGGTTDKDGKLTLCSGETVEFPGIPVGAKVRVTETQEEDAYWEAVDEVYSKEITVSESEANSLEITNTTKAVTLDKVIYVEAGKDGGTDYTIKDGENTVKVETAQPTEGTPSGEITVTVTDDGTLNVNPTPANKTYEIEYTGKKDNGVGVSGKITVHTYALTDDVYVFDYGLKSDLADTTHGNGMFQNDNLFIDGVDTTAKLTELDDSALTQSTITLEGNSSTPLNLEKYESTSGAKLKDNNKVIFEPTAFMDKQETATYGTTVYALGKETVQSPEDGVVLSDADVKVMPANVVYYEDNFSGIELTGNTSENGIATGGNHENDMQSNENDTLHGNDNAYADDAQDSDGGSIILKTDASYDADGNYIKPEKGSDTVKFTFKGTGFDIVGRSSTNSGILTVLYSWQENGQTKSKILVVDTYFANGNLYQIPVVSVKDLEYREYTVQISLAASSRGNTFYLDGVRVYNPARDDKSVTDNYQEEEQNVTFQNVHDILVGDGDVTDTIITVPDPYDSETFWSYVVDIEAEGRSAAMVKVPSTANEIDEVTIDSTPELFGQSNVEDINDQEDHQGTIYTYTETLNDYLAKGPNNEVYLGTQDAIAFYVESANGNVPQTLQVEAKKVAIGGYEVTDPEDFADFSVPVLRTVTKTKEAFSTNTIATIKTSTAMYYEIPVNEENCIKIADNKYLVIIVGSTTEEECISISNIKSNGYTISLPEIDNENITLNADAQGAIEGEHDCEIKVEKITVTNPKVKKYATITMTVSGYEAERKEAIDFDIYFDSANVDDISIMDKGKVKDFQSQDNGDETITYTFQLKMPTKAQTMKLVVIPKYTDTDTQSVYSTEKTISVKK